MAGWLRDRPQGANSPRSLGAAAVGGVGSRRRTPDRGGRHGPFAAASARHVICALYWDGWDLRSPKIIAAEESQQVRCLPFRCGWRQSYFALLLGGTRPGPPPFSGKNSMPASSRTGHDRGGRLLTCLPASAAWFPARSDRWFRIPRRRIRANRGPPAALRPAGRAPRCARTCPNSTRLLGVYANRHVGARNSCERDGQHPAGKDDVRC